MLFEMLTGHLPFEADTAMQVLVAVIEHAPPLPTQMAASRGLPPVDPALEAICLTALAKRPEERYPGAKAFGEALTHWLAKPAYVPVPAGAVPVPRRAWALPLGALLLLAAFVAAALVPSRVEVPWPKIEHPGGKAMAVAFTPDGSRLVSGGEDGVVRFWDLGGKRLAASLEALGGKIESMALSPDGKRLVAVTEDRDDGDAPGEAAVWDLPGATPARRLEGHLTGINAVAFSRDGVRVATGDRKGVLRVWEAATGRLLFEKQAHGQAVRAIAFGPGGGFATASWDRKVRLWGADGAERGVLKGFEQGIWGVAVSPDGGRVATADSERKVRVWDLGKPGTPGRVLGSHKKEAVCAVFSPDGRRVASGGWDRVARVWDVERGGELAAFEGHADFVWCLAFSHDGRWLATAGLDGTLRLWPAP
jgi:sugar lactone lactonase YvrE